MATNPFDVTKATDLTDEEIQSTWVPWAPKQNSLLADPRSATAQLLTGDKGGGRTHLMRHMSFAVQRLRHPEDPLAGVAEEGYLGIYGRCEGLNSFRFEGKGLDTTVWAAVFAYYFDLWLARLLLVNIRELYAATQHEGELAEELRRFSSEVMAMIELSPDDSSSDLASVEREISSVLRELDLSINNAGRIGYAPEMPHIRTSPGQLVFKIPELASQLPGLTGIRFTYLVDEFENLTLEQQKYLNTLIREKTLPTTFIVGSRASGVKDYPTFSGGEINRDGSEFRRVVLEDRYRVLPGQYRAFCRSIIQTRLQSTDSTRFEKISRFAEEIEQIDDDDGYFSAASARLYGSYLAKRRLTTVSVDGRPWQHRLAAQLESAELPSVAAEQIVSTLAFPEHLLLEKFAIFRLYQCWARRQPLLASAATAKDEVLELLDSPGAASKRGVFQHWKGDLFDQLRSDLQETPDYYGFNSFLALSSFLPRNLLVLLKNVTYWAEFSGDGREGGPSVSLESQRRGIAEAADWFFGDRVPIGALGVHVDHAVRRLGTLLEEVRFADKPVEVSCSTFSTNYRGLSERAVEVLELAASCGLLVRLPGGRVDRNTGIPETAFQMNPMICPKFRLPLGRRGIAKISSQLLNAVFDDEVSDEVFRRLVDQRLADVTAPFAAGRATGASSQQLRF